MELACEKRPSKDDAGITWCSGAAFQHTVSIGFTQENVEGDHAVNGTLYESPYNKDSFAAFTFADGQFPFDFDDRLPRPYGKRQTPAEAGLCSSV